MLVTIAMIGILIQDLTKEISSSMREAMRMWNKYSPAISVVEEDITNQGIKNLDHR